MRTMCLALTMAAKIVKGVFYPLENNMEIRKKGVVMSLIRSIRFLPCWLGVITLLASTLAELPDKDVKFIFVVQASCLIKIVLLYSASGSSRKWKLYPFYDTTEMRTC